MNNKNIANEWFDIAEKNLTSAIFLQKINFLIS